MFLLRVALSLTRFFVVLRSDLSNGFKSAQNAAFSSSLGLAAHLVLGRVTTYAKPEFSICLECVVSSFFIFFFALPFLRPGILYLRCLFVALFAY